MNIMIAGGSGTIGQVLVKHLLVHGHRVSVLTRHPEQASLPEGAQAVGWDGKTSQGWGERLVEVDAIVNLAGENLGSMPWTNDRKARIRNSRMQVGQALVDAVRSGERRPKVLLQASAVGYYGPRGNEELTEESPPGNDFQAGVVQDWEASTQPVEELGVRRVVTRSGIVLTPAGGALPRFLWPWQFYLGGPLGSGRQWMSWIHIQDEVAAIRFLLENEGASGVFNLTTPHPVTNAEFGRTLASVMNRPFWLPVPAFGLRLLLGEMSTVVLDGQRVLPEGLQTSGYTFAFPELRQALEDLL